MDDIMSLLDFADKVLYLDNIDELRDEEYKLKEQLFRNADLMRLADSISALAWELVSMKEELRIENEKNSAELSDDEKAENAAVQSILDFNLLSYHFQPIIDARTGEIYSYEALMRAVGHEGITPYHILKYARLSDRLCDVEQYTFLNVLRYIDDHADLFGDRRVFINSIPSVRIRQEKEAEINAMLGSMSDYVVVEMTENTMFNDDELSEIKDRYRRLGIRIAIDDFGTGYSNISNLLRYTPNYVKIDRNLISGISENPNKKHFVREIIDFCHDNDILVLAEGVETSEELRTVILMGIDLIQGFYTARPSAEVVSDLPYDVVSEVRRYRQEKEDGKRINVYYADSHEKISLDRLLKEGYTRIQIGNGGDVGVVTVIGEQKLFTDINIETKDGFCGKIVLQNTVLSNAVGRPSITLGENNDVSIILMGMNKLKNGGIRVPETSRLTLEGKGSLDIELGASDYYGIGNDLDSKHGELIFDQDGTVSITASSNSGVCIGSGQGGTVSIRRGRYVLNGLGSMSVCVGSFTGDTNIDITGCDLNALAKGAYCAVIGSLYGNASVHMLYSSLKCTADSQLAVAYGSLHGVRAYVYAGSVNLGVSMNADKMTAFGALAGDTEVQIERSSVRVNSDGPSALIFGGADGSTVLSLTDADLFAEMSTSSRTCTYALPENIVTSGGRNRINLNGTVYDRLTDL